MSHGSSPQERIENALESIATNYNGINIRQIPIEIVPGLPNLGRYYHANEKLDSLTKIIPSLRRYCLCERKIVLSDEVFESPELSKEFNGIDAVEVVLHHELLHFLIDTKQIEFDDDNEDIWIDNLLKDYYQNRDGGWDKHKSGLSFPEAKRLEKLIKKFNTDGEYRRKIHMLGNKAILERKTTGVKLAEEHLAFMAFMSRY